MTTAKRQKQNGMAEDAALAHRRLRRGTGQRACDCQHLHGRPQRLGKPKRWRESPGRVLGNERRLPGLTADGSHIGDAAYQIQPKSHEDLTIHHALTIRARQFYYEAMVNAKISRALRAGNTRQHTTAEPRRVGQHAKLWVGNGETSDKRLHGWWDCEVIGVQKDAKAYMLRRKGGQVITRDANVVRFADP